MNGSASKSVEKDMFPDCEGIGGWLLGVSVCVCDDAQDVRREESSTGSDGGGGGGLYKIYIS